MFHSQYYLVATVIRTQSLTSQICVYEHMLVTIQGRWSDKGNKKLGRAVNAACEGNFQRAILGTRAIGSAALVLTTNATDSKLQ
jgi:hypothetical protein